MLRLDTAFGPFVKLIDGGRIYVIPKYQRPYSWTATKQVAELWADIARLYKGREVSPDSLESHFIGSVVIGSAATKALGAVEVPVIDGQQRLITLSLVMIAIRDSLIASADDRYRVSAKYLAHFTPDQEIQDCRVRAGDADRATYEALVHGQPVHDNKSTVIRAYNYIAAQLNKGSDSLSDPDETDDSEPVQDSGDNEADDATAANEPSMHSSWKWELLVEVVGSQLELVSISDVPAENAYSIFASLNSTGTPLAQIDLIRNAIFMLLPKSGDKVHKDLWTPLEQALGRDMLQNYFHAWVQLKGHNVPVKDTYRSVVSELARPGDKEAAVKRAVQGIYDDAWGYLLIKKPTDQRSRDRFKGPETPSVTAPVVAALARLQAWGTVPMEPVLLSLINAWRDPNAAFSTQDLLKCLTHLESFVVRRFIAHVPPNDLRSIYARITQQLLKRDDRSAIEVLKTSLMETNRRWPTDDEIRESMTRKALYRSPGQNMTFFVLKRIAEMLEGKECPHLVLGTGSTDYSIEHVLPQTLSDDWQKDLAAWGAKEPHRVWQDFLHTAGNLTLTAYNSELHNYSFDKKKEWIKGHLRLMLSKQILSDKKWSAEQIQSRSSSMAELALDIWPRP